MEIVFFPFARPERGRRLDRRIRQIISSGKYAIRGVAPRSVSTRATRADFFSAPGRHDTLNKGDAHDCRPCRRNA